MLKRCSIHIIQGSFRIAVDYAGSSVSCNGSCSSTHCAPVRGPELNILLISTARMDSVSAGVIYSLAMCLSCLASVGSCPG